MIYTTRYNIHLPSSRNHGEKHGTTHIKKKLIEEGTWDTHKGTLGWALDGIALTIKLHTTE